MFFHSNFCVFLLFYHFLLNQIWRNKARAYICFRLFIRKQLHFSHNPEQTLRAADIASFFSADATVRSCQEQECAAAYSK